MSEQYGIRESREGWIVYPINVPVFDTREQAEAHAKRLYSESDQLGVAVGLARKSLELLESVQWAREDLRNYGCTSVDTCPDCQAERKKGHYESCDMKEVIDGWTAFLAGAKEGRDG